VGVPAVVKEVPQVLLVQVRWRQSLSVPGHCDDALHWTHVPKPLQTLPPFWLHGEFKGTGGLLGVPALQTSPVHWLPSTGKSLSSTTLTTFPKPSHSLR
jgi:hypothetical protein